MRNFLIDTDTASDDAVEIMIARGGKAWRTRIAPASAALRASASRGTRSVDFFCHCAICQKIYWKPFADVTYFWASSAMLLPNQPIEFRRYRPPPAMRRGTCAKCGNPVLSLLGRGLALAFVPSQNFPRPGELPAPDRHIFYDRRVADISDNIPKITGYWASEVYVTRSILAGFFGRPRAA
jgi:hypothetical protein